MTGANCDLTTLQVWAGYLSWLGFVKVLGASVLAAGVVTLSWGVLTRIVFRARVLLEAAGYVASAAMLAGGWWVPRDHLVWVVLTGCLVFAATVMATLYIHRIKGDDPKPITGLFMLVWGAAAVVYDMPEAGFLTMAALMSLLGFSVVIRRLEYAFGFEDREVIPSATMAAAIVVVGFLVARLAVPAAPWFVEVFMPGAFWVGTFVAFTGLLIMSSRYYSREPAGLVFAQLLFLGAALGGVAVGMVFGINALAGISGTFLVLYLAEKPLEISPRNAIGVGAMLICSGAVMYGAWALAMAHEDVVRRYLTTHL